MNATEMIRSYAAVNGIIKKKAAEDSLGLTKGQVKSSVATLVRNGSLTRIGHGMYRFVNETEKPVADVTNKIWRAMKISTTFSVGDIAMLSGTTTAYVYKRVRQYKADGFIKPAGARPTHGSREKLWRLTGTGKAKAQYLSTETYTPDPLTMAAVNLNRLICSGLVARNKDAANQACAIVDEIKDAIKALDLDE